MSFNKEQFEGLIMHVINKLELYSPSAVNLLLGTAAQESGFGTYLRQVNGPALGVFQMEPGTMTDIYDNYLKYRARLRQIIMNVTMVSFPSVMALEYNLAYQIALARIHYVRIPDPIPLDLPGLAHYWKQYYNTPKGKGTEEEFIKNYNRYVLDK